jgi:hypothetical protein
LECRLYADGTLLAVLGEVRLQRCEPLLSTNRRRNSGEGAAAMSALADNICHVSKQDDTIPRFDAVPADAVPNREGGAAGAPIQRFHAPSWTTPISSHSTLPCHPDSARLASRAEESQSDRLWSASQYFHQGWRSAAGRLRFLRLRSGQALQEREGERAVGMTTRLDSDVGDAVQGKHEAGAPRLKRLRSLRARSKRRAVGMTGLGMHPERALFAPFVRP